MRRKKKYPIPKGQPWLSPTPQSNHHKEPTALGTVDMPGPKPHPPSQGSGVAGGPSRPPPPPPPVVLSF